MMTSTSLLKRTTRNAGSDATGALLLRAKQGGPARALVPLLRVVHCESGGTIRRYYRLRLSDVLQIGGFIEVQQRAGFALVDAGRWVWRRERGRVAHALGR
jgi:hypothetical protein